MSALDSLAEQRIREAQEAGAFDDLPGAGMPLDLDEDALVPQELRAAYRLLRNSGFLPPELAVHGEIREVEELLRKVEDGAERSRLCARLDFLLGRTRRTHLSVEAAYYEEMAAAVDRRRKDRP